MEVPSHRHWPEAYVPPALDGAGDDDWPPASREIAIEQARQVRLEEGGLPIDDATLERVADAVMDPEYPVPGWYYTAEELADDELEEAGGVPWGALVDVAHELGADERAARGGDDPLAFEQVPRTVNALEAISDRLLADRAALEAAGFTLLGIVTDEQRAMVQTTVVGGEDAAAAERYFAGRYGDAVAIEWLGPSRYREVAHPFGSWTSDGCVIRVFFGLDLNGQRRGSARVAEEGGDRIVIALTCLQPLGFTTLIGGFRPHHEDLELHEPVGDRAVIDASADARRPSLGELRTR